MMTLKIECPGCQQAFEVSEDLDGRTVECGSCENRFQVTKDVMAAQREKFYPDERRKEVDLSRFGRTPATSAPVEFRAMEYDHKASQIIVGPAAPVRNFAVAGGLVILVFVAVVLYFGSLPTSSILQDVEKPQRLTVAGFFGLVALLLLGWGMIKNRILGIFIGIIGAVGLLALANYLPVYRTATSLDGAVAASPEGEADVPAVKPDSPFFPGITAEKALTPQEVRRKTRWDATVLPLVANGDETQVAAIWVRSMEEFHKSQIRNYLSQELGLPVRPDFRELRDGGVFVLSGIPLDLDQVEFVVERFGKVEQVIPELRLIQMQVNASVLGEVSNELTGKLNNSQDGAFYSLNYSELIALDRSRVKEAIRRLTSAQPIRMRTDITVRLVGLLSSEQDVETYASIAAALRVWSEEGDGADRLLAGHASKMRGEGLKVPDEILRLLAERKTPSATALLVEMWAEDPAGRQQFVETFGSGAAALVIPYLRSSKPGLPRSAARLLGQIGTSNQLSAMREALSASQDEEFKVALKEAIERVARR